MKINKKMNKLMNIFNKSMIYNKNMIIFIKKIKKFKTINKYSFKISQKI